MVWPVSMYSDAHPLKKKGGGLYYGVLVSISVSLLFINYLPFQPVC